MAGRASRNGAEPYYRERLWPASWVWLVAAGFGGSLGVAYGYAYGSAAGWVVGAATAVLLLAGVAWLGHSAIVVWPDRLVAGAAALPLEWIGRTAALDRDQTVVARTTKADARAFLFLRTWAAPTAAVVEVTDPADPHPYWLVSSRRPQQFVAALDRATQEARARRADPATH